MEIQDREIEEILGRTDRKFLFAISAAVFAGNAAQCLRIIDEAHYAGLDMPFFYQMLLQHFRNLLFTKIVNREDNILQVGEEELLKLEEQTADVSLDTLQRLLDILMSEEDHIRRSRHPRMNIEATLVRMAGLEPLIPIDQMISRMEDLEKRLSGDHGGSAAGKAPAPQAVYDGVTDRAISSPVGEKTLAAYKTSTKPLDLPGRNKEKVNASPSGDLASLWEDFKAHIKKSMPPLFWSKVEPGRILAFEDNVLQIGFPRNHYDIFIHEEEKHNLRLQAAAFLQNDQVMVRIESVEEGNGCLSGGNGPGGNNRRTESKREIINHPAIQKILDVFEGAEVKEVVSRRPVGEDRSEHQS